MIGTTISHSFSWPTGLLTRTLPCAHLPRQRAMDSCTVHAAFGKPPDAELGPDYTRRLQDHMEWCVKACTVHFLAGELVWVYSPKRKKGQCPKLDSNWLGPRSVLESVGEVVYGVQLPPRGRRVVLHRDRLEPYRGHSLPPFWRSVCKPCFHCTHGLTGWTVISPFMGTTMAADPVV